MKSAMDSEEYGHLVVIGMNGEPDAYRQHRFKVEFHEQNTSLIELRKGGFSSMSQTKSIMHLASPAGGQDFQVEYMPSESYQMYQIGRSLSKKINFFVDMPQPYATSTVSRFACRLLVDRVNRPGVGGDWVARIYAGAFDEKNKIFLASKEPVKSKFDQELDGFTANGVLILKAKLDSKNKFSGFLDAAHADDPESCIKRWREVSARGKLFKLREKRLPPTVDDEVSSKEEDNQLTDGTIIDLGGVSLLWRSTAAVVDSAKLEQALQNPNRKLIDPMTLDTLFLRSKSQSTNADTAKNTPHAYMGCGHVVRKSSEAPPDRCPIMSCNKPGKLVELKWPNEPLFFVDDGELEYCFSPCGHIVNEKTAQAWSQVAFIREPPVSLCPFCAEPLDSDKKYVKLELTVDF